MLTGSQFAEQARNGNYIGIPYTKLDCQAFVEKVLKDCGIQYNWRGSNHMWRNALSEKHEITDIDKIPVGAWLFNVQRDGGEKKRGYSDNEGNAKHVGIYLGSYDVIHSTTGGVQWDSIFSNRWNHWGLCKFIKYDSMDAGSETENAQAPTNAPAELVKLLREFFETARKRGWI